MNPNSKRQNQNEFATIARCRDAKRRIRCAVLIAGSFFVSTHVGLAKTFNVDVGSNGDFVFSPFAVSIQPGDTVKWTWKSIFHSVTSVRQLRLPACSIQEFRAPDIPFLYLSRPGNLLLLLLAARILLRDDWNRSGCWLDATANPNPNAGPAAEYFDTDGRADGRPGAHRWQ